MDGKSIRWFLSGLGAAAAITVPLIFNAGGWKTGINDQVTNLSTEVKQINDHLQNEDTHIEQQNDYLQKEQRQIQWLIDHNQDARYAPDGLAKPQALKVPRLHIAERTQVSGTRIPYVTPE